MSPTTAAARRYMFYAVSIEGTAFGRACAAAGANDQDWAGRDGEQLAMPGSAHVVGYSADVGR